MSEDRERVDRLHRGGWGSYAISQATGVPEATVRRWIDPDYAEKLRAAALRYKKSVMGICVVCGGQTRYNGRPKAPTYKNGASTLCVSCSRNQQHELRYWTPEQIILRLRELATVLGRTPTSTDSLLYYGAPSIEAKCTAERIAEVRLIPRHLNPPPLDVVRREFGSWTAAFDAADLSRPPRGMKARRSRPSDATAKLTA